MRNGAVTKAGTGPTRIPSTPSLVMTAILDGSLPKQTADRGKQYFCTLAGTQSYEVISF